MGKSSLDVKNIFNVTFEAYGFDEPPRYIVTAGQVKLTFHPQGHKTMHIALGNLAMCANYFQSNPNKWDEAFDHFDDKVIMRAIHTYIHTKIYNFPEKILLATDPIATFIEDIRKILSYLNE